MEHKTQKKVMPTNCDSCMYYTYDEHYADYACEMALDEDEMLLYRAEQFKACPYYRYKDEYISVRKQN